MRRHTAGGFAVVMTGLLLAGAPIGRDRSFRFGVRVEQPPEGGDDGRLRLSKPRQLLIVLPPTAEAFVERDQRLCGRLLGRRPLVFQRVFLALSVEHVEEIGEAAIIALGSERDRTLTGG